GNNNNDFFPTDPASYDLDNIIAVAATDNRDHLAVFSNVGHNSVDLGAPGVEVLSTLPASGTLGNPSGYGYLSGTSMATPHVSGVAALAWGVNPGATALQIKDAILAGVDPDPALAGLTLTGGRLNAFNTLQQLGLNVASTDPAVGSVVFARPTDFAVSF